MKQVLLILSTLFLLFSCASENGSSSSTSKSASGSQPKPGRISTLLEPAAPLTIALGEEIEVKLVVPDSVQVDSIQVFLGGALRQSMQKPFAAEASRELQFTLATKDQSTGRSGLRIRLFFAGGTTENQSQQLTFLSDVVPVQYTYQVVKEYPHDRGAYTQGLQYDDGFLYEGTGERGTSSLRKSVLETGEVVQIRDMDQSLFGEGIAVMGERIYQITYTSQVGFIYDKSTFQEIQKVYYQNREGWGLTHNGEELIMSDGTHVLYFLDPEMFTINRQIEVYHNEGLADSLNELEYINGKIWANRYYTDEIVIIDPVSGKVEGRINLKGILKTTDRRPNTDVLNGIAWDQEGDRLFVTGKRWPKLFEIKIRKSG